MNVESRELAICVGNRCTEVLMDQSENDVGLRLYTGSVQLVHSVTLTQ